MGSAAVDKSTETLVEAIKFAPGPGVILRFFVSLGYAGAMNQWKLSGTDVISAGVGLVSLPAGLAVTGIGKVKEHDEAMRALYSLWAQKALSQNDKLKPQELSQGFCKWYDEEVKKQNQETVEKALKAMNTPGTRFGDPGMPGSPGHTD